MARRAASFFVATIWAAVAWTSIVQAAGQPPVDSRNGMLGRVAIQGSAEQRQQIVDAIAASPVLTERLVALSARGALSTIDVVETSPAVPSSVGPDRPFAAAAPVRGPFAAALDGSKILLSSGLLSALRRTRLFDVATPDDVLPNQTVFVLAHLSDHLVNPVSRRPLVAESNDDYVTRMIASEASAYLVAWNATVDEAVHRRGGVTMSPNQIGTLLLNCRYRFALIGRGAHVTGPQLSPSGRIDPTPSNIDAIVQTLRQSPLADLE